MIRLATEKDSEHLLILSANSFGNGFHQESYFTNIINHHHCYVYDENQTIKGFCTVLIHPDSLQIDSVVVDANFQNQGIATRMLQEVLFDYPNHKMFSYAWKQGDEANLHAIYQRLGFNKSKELPNYWLESSIKEGFSCIVCGNPCYCTAVLYEKG
jgi:ribosomal protein S18 acetylase RimI-like enzyme